jgi:mRNA interferase RelE/StbE
LSFPAADPRHPSLRVKKIRGTASVFEARVDGDFRFTFEYGERHEIILRIVGPHGPTLKKP